MGEITAREQQAWLPAFNGFQNISDTYDDSLDDRTTPTPATHGIPIIKTAITRLNQQQPPHQFQQAQALLLHKFQLELTLTSYIKAMTTKHGLDAIVRLFGPVGKIGKANKLITPRIGRAIGSAAAASHLPPPSRLHTHQVDARREPQGATAPASDFPARPASAQTSRCRRRFQPAHAARVGGCLHAGGAAGYRADGRSWNDQGSAPHAGYEQRGARKRNGSD